MDCMETMDIVLIQVIKPEHTGGYMDRLNSGMVGSRIQIHVTFLNMENSEDGCEWKQTLETKRKLSFLLKPLRWRFHSISIFTGLLWILIIVTVN